METLRKEILNVLSGEEDLLKEGSFSQYCETFFNCRSTGNTCVIFGIKKQELMTEMFGFNYPSLINDSVHYLIRLKSSDKEEVQITFSDKTVGCSIEQQDKIKALFCNYNADKNINLGLYFAQKRRIPPLTLEDNWAPEFMDNPNENFRALDGEKLIEKVEIKHPKVIDVKLYRSLDDVFVIPEKNSRYAEYKKMAQQDVENPKQDSEDFFDKIATMISGIGAEPEKKNQNSVFWKWFSENIRNVDKINFLILNHNDDFVILTFINLIKSGMQILTCSNGYFSSMTKVLSQQRQPTRRNFPTTPKSCLKNCMVHCVKSKTNSATARYTFAHWSFWRNLTPRQSKRTKKHWQR